MKYGKALINLCVIICLLFTISSVCASDINENITDELTTNEDIQIIEENEIISASDNGSFTALREKINSGYNSTIMLENDYEDDGSGGIGITDKITIDGQGHKIDAKNQGRIFYIQDCSNVILKNIIFVNAHVEDREIGAAITAARASNLEISNCSFINSTASNGGAVYMFESANWTFTGCSFKDNSANLVGGALTLSSCKNCVVSECSFTHNTADEDGGAIMEIDGANNTISGCIFENNSAKNYAGAVYGTRSNDTVVTYCTFINNTGANTGAIHRSNCKNGTVSYCNFINNSATNTDYNTGSAIFWDNGANSTVSYCNFTGNSVNTGSTLFWEYSHDGIVSNCRFVNNTGDNESTSSNGAIYWKNSERGAVSDCYFADNIGGEGGGIFWYYSNYGTVSDCEFKNNRGKFGGATEIEHSDEFSITNCEFENNTAIQGGAMYAYTGQNCQVSNCEFKNNTAKNGGAIMWNEHNHAIVSNCKFENNTCKGSSYPEGGAIYWQLSSNSVVSNSIFIGNNGKTGGALHFRSDNGTVIGCIFVNNTADNGIIYVASYYQRKNFKANNNIFLNNNGQAITISESYETINTNYNWFGHNATNYKECNDSTEGTFDTWLFLNATANPSEITLSNKTTITFNLYAYNSTSKSISDAHAVMPINLTITTTSGSVDKDIVGLGEAITFTPNALGTSDITAKIENITDTVKIDVYEGTFEELQNIINNAAEGSTITLEKDYTFTKGFSTDGIVIGKSIIIDGNGHTLNGNNIASIFKINSDNVILENINFINGYATKDTQNGGAIHIFEHAYIAISNCNFTNNYASYFGGAINLHRCHDCYISDCSFENNTAFISGGAIYENECNNCTISDCDFKNNGVFQFGGAVKLQISDDCSIFDCNFKDNYAKFGFSPIEGGAIDWEGNNGQISGCIFTNNIADNAGAICWRGNNGQISDCIFKNNNANSQGGAIYFLYTSKNNTLSNCIFINNTAKYGGALSNGTAVNCVFIGNHGTNGGAMRYGTADSCIFKTSTDKCEETTILSPTLNVENSTFSFNSSEKFKFNLTANNGMPITNANISISVYYKENNTWVGNYSCISGKGWTVDLPRGTYVAVFNTEYAGFTPVNATVTVIKGNSTLTVPDITFDYGSTGSATVNITNAIGIIAEVTGHSEAIVTVKDNVITVSNLTAGTYTLNVTTITSDDYNNVTKTANITVNKLNTEITAANKDYIINYGGTYAVTLKDANGNALADQKVTFTLNGKNIGTAVTNAQGAASIKLTAAALKTAKAGTKNLVIKFAGDSNYVGASKTVKITINKEKTKIAAKKKTFKKTKKVKKYSVTLKNSKNKAVKKVQVTLKVKGKTYKAKTNNKGKATFKIKNLKKKGHCLKLS